MSEKIRLKKLVLTTADGKEIELSLEEARELHEQLDALFGQKYVTTTPVIIERHRSPWDPHFTPITWDGSNTGTPEPNFPAVTCDGSDANDAPRNLLGNATCTVKSQSGMKVVYGGPLEF